MLSIVGLVVAISLSFAQNPSKPKRTPEQKAVKRSEMLAQKLTLTNEQKQSIYVLILDRTTKVEAVKAKYAADKKGMGKELKPIRDNFDTQMKAILTPDQATKWEQLRAEEKAKNKVDKETKGHEEGLGD